MSLLDRELSGVVMTTDNIRTKRMPLLVNFGVAIAALLVAAAIVYGAGIGNYVLVIVIGGALYLVGLAVVAGRIEGRR